MGDSQSQDEIKGFDSFELRLGDELRGERATLGRSLLDVQRDLRIKAAYISAIENCDLTAFENTAYVAGYVRSYARYLGLDPELTFARFCQEAGFLGAHPDLGRRREGRSGMNVAAISAGAMGPSNSLGRFAMARGRTAPSISLGGLAPVLVLVSVIFGLVAGGWIIVRDIQRVSFAPIDRAPELVDEIAAAIAMAGAQSSADEPLVRLRNADPVISVFAQQPAWIRVTDASGRTLFERVLDAGTTYELPSGVEGARLRAGNATAVFLMIDGETYGPVRTDGSVASNVALAAADISGTFPALGTLTAEMRAVVAELESRFATLTEPQ